MKTTGLMTYRDALIMDPEQQQVTDQSVKNELARLGVAENKAVFKYDYSREFPVSKMYQIDDPGSPHHGAHIAVISQLPMVNVRGEKCLPGWRRNPNGSYSANPNQFEADVATSGAVAVTPHNDQPSGVKVGVTTSWKPRLLLNGHEVMAVSGPTLLDVDPVNPNYQQNVIEWDYGVCKRWLRLIEGRLLERWVFSQNPGATVRIEHGFEGPKLKLGPYAVDDDTEQVTAEQFSQAQYPFSISATGTFYPDADAETTTHDAALHNTSQNTSWTSLRAIAGTTALDAYQYVYDNFRSTSSTSNWQYITRSQFLFDTSSIGANTVISSVTFSLYLNTNYGANAGSGSGTHVCSSNPASNTGAATGDFALLGTTSFGSLAHGSWAAGYNNIALNASGIAAVNKTGITKLGIRSNFDLDGSEPTWVSETTYGIRCYASEQGEGYKPKLVVVYDTIVAPTVTTSAASSIGETSATMNGSVSATGFENPTRYFQYGKTAAYELGSINKGVGGAGGFSHALSGLDPDTLYYFRAYATNSAGTGYGSQQTFTTLASGQPLAGRIRGRMMHGGNRGTF